MAARFDASGDGLRRTANLPALTAFTLAGWGYRHSLRAGQYQYFAGIESETSNSNGYVLLGWRDDGVMGLDSNNGAAAFGSSPANDTWFYWFIRSNGTNSYQAGWKLSGGSWTTITLSAALAWVPAMLSLGNDSWGEWCDLALERVRCWDAALTNAELDSEAASATPVRTSSLRNWPLVSDASETVNGYSLTANGSVSYEAGPTFGGGGVVVTPAAAGSAGAAVAPTVVRGALAFVPATAASAAAAIAPAIVQGAPVALTPALAAAATSALSPAVVRGAVTVAPGAAAAAASTRFVLLAGATVGGVLTVDPTNGRYFRNAAGPLVLAGFHTWADVQDTGSTSPPGAFDWTGYLDDLVARGCNWTKLWFMESARDWGDASPLYFAPHPWPRTGPGTAADGLPKFDLSQHNAAYFERLRERAIEAGNRGVYVCVQLFQGWHVESKGLTYNPWTYHPLASGNNVNGVNGDTNGDGKGLETRNDSISAVTTIQRTYVAQVLAALNDLDNVIYEISNEDHDSSWAWQTGLVDYIRATEAGMAQQHLVGLTVLWPTANNAALAASDADWVSYADSDAAPDAPTAGPVSAYDSDHNPNVLTSNYKWIWQALTRGHGGLWSMDEYAGETYGNDTRAQAAYVKQRANLGYALGMAAQIDLAAATVQSGLASTGYCLAVMTGRYQVLAYQDGSGAFTVNLASLPGTFSLLWLRPATGATQAGSNVSGGATRTLTPPWAGEDAVALLERISIDVAPAFAAAAAGAGAPAVVYGAIVTTPGAAGSVAGVTAPAVVLGALSIAPGAAGAAAGAGTPAVIMSGLIVTPVTAASAAGVAGPAVILGALTLAPLLADAVAGAASPAVIAGEAVTVAPEAAAATSAALAPAVVYGPLVIAPIAAAAAAGAPSPIVTTGGVTVLPAWGAAGTAAGAPLLVLGAVAVAPSFAAAGAGATLGAVQEGAAVTVAPDVAAAGTGANAPAVVLGPAVIAPAAAGAQAVAPNPAVVIGLIVAVTTLYAQRNLVLRSDRSLVLVYRR